MFSDCTEHISGKGISFLVVLELLNSNNTVKILYSFFLKVAAQILLRDIRTKAFVILITKREKRKRD